MTAFSKSIPTYGDVEAAANRITPLINRTPVLTSQNLNRMTNAELFFKGENFQKAGAFKFRGACNAICSFSAKELRHGVATHSSGNHGQAVALAAKLRDIPAYIIIPKNAPAVKINAVKGYGAHITFCEPTLQAREESLAHILEETKAQFIHPSNDPKVIAGQGTAALELLADIPDLDNIIVPVGGGGLLSGTALAVRGGAGDVSVFGAEPLGADDAFRSLQAGRLITPENPHSVADGLLTSLGGSDISRNSEMRSPDHDGERSYDYRCDATCLGASENRHRTIGGSAGRRITGECGPVRRDTHGDNNLRRECGSRIPSMDSTKRFARSPG